MEDIVQTMRSKIKITQLGDLSGKRGGSGGAAFQVSYSYTDRMKAQLVVKELVARFLEQNLRVQRDAVSVTTTFLGDELKSAKDRMDKVEADISKFKLANRENCRNRLSRTRRRRPTTCSSS